MNIHQDALTPVHGYLEGNADAADAADARTAIDYKRSVTRDYINVAADQLDSRLGGTQFFVTRKYDGEMNVLFFDGAQAAIINRSGRIRRGLACVEDAAQALVRAGVGSAVIPAELYADESAGRTRVSQVLAALADETRTATLRLAAFDILELDGAAYKPGSYAETHAKLAEVFAGASLAAPVEGRPCASRSEVAAIYSEWVEGAGAEGLVVRTELPLVYKVKPRYTIDAVIVGYSEGMADQVGQVRSVLLALMPGADEFQIIGRTGGGLTEEEKRALFDRLSGMTVDSAYIEVDSNHVAFHMVRPEIVIEVMIGDVLFDTTTGPIDNPVLSLDAGRFTRLRDVRGISLVYPTFVRFRDDKQADVADVPLGQIDEFSVVAPAAPAPAADYPASQVLRRAVYKKTQGTKLMVQKFVVWKTNKPAPDYPGYVFHYTNFSSERKDPLQRDVMISDDEAQIMALCEASIADNVRAGWTAVP